MTDRHTESDRDEATRADDTRTLVCAIRAAQARQVDALLLRACSAHVSSDEPEP